MILLTRGIGHHSTRSFFELLKDQNDNVVPCNFCNSHCKSLKCV